MADKVLKKFKHEKHKVEVLKLEKNMITNFFSTERPLTVTSFFRVNISGDYLNFSVFLETQTELTKENFRRGTGLKTITKHSINTFSHSRKTKEEFFSEALEFFSEDIKKISEENIKHALKVSMEVSLLFAADPSYSSNSSLFQISKEFIFKKGFSEVTIKKDEFTISFIYCSETNHVSELKVNRFFDSSDISFRFGEFNKETSEIEELLISQISLEAFPDPVKLKLVFA